MKLRYGNHETEVSASDETRPPHGQHCVWFTGLSGAGKTTLARELEALLRSTGVRVVVLDGDELRSSTSRDLGYSPEDRARNVLRAGALACEAARSGAIAVVALTSPSEQTRSACAQRCEAAGVRFVLVHVATPLAVCEARDPKGLYAAARAGRITDFVGVDLPYETPSAPVLRIDTSQEALADAVRNVAELLRTAPATCAARVRRAPA